MNSRTWLFVLISTFFRHTFTDNFPATDATTPPPTIAAASAAASRENLMSAYFSKLVVAGSAPHCTELCAGLLTAGNIIGVEAGRTHCE